MAVIVIVFILAIFSIGVLAVIGRCFSAMVTHGSAAPEAVQQHPTDLSLGQHYRHQYLERSVGVAGLDPRTVRALPVMTYAGGDTVGGCVVCLGEFEEKEQVKVIPGCGHVFHPDCIGGWLVLHGSCPICRCSHLFAAGAAAAANAGEVWVNFDSGDGDSGGGPHEEEENGSSIAVTENGGARPEEGKLVWLGRSESFRSCERGGRESCKTFLRRTCSF